MAEVVVFTAARTKQIEDTAIIDGVVDPAGDLILVTRDGTEINAGHVMGPKGDDGEDGTDAVLPPAGSDPVYNDYFVYSMMGVI